MSYAEEAYLIFQIKNYCSKFSEKEGIPKNYFADTEILSLFLPQSDTSILENAVAAALYQKYQDRVFFIKSSKTGLDIDFFIPEEKTLIQVAYSLNDSSKKREVESLKKAHRHILEAKSFIILHMLKAKQSNWMILRLQSNLYGDGCLKTSLKLKPS